MCSCIPKHPDVYLCYLSLADGGHLSVRASWLVLDRLQFQSVQPDPGTLGLPNFAFRMESCVAGKKRESLGNGLIRISILSHPGRDREGTATAGLYVPPLPSLSLVLVSVFL